MPGHILIKLTKIKHKEQILKISREKQQITYKGIPIRITADLSIETFNRPERNGRIYLKWWKRKTYNQDYSTQQGSHSDSKEKPKALQAKAERIQHHQTSSPTNAKGYSLDRKHKKMYKLEPQTIK